MFLSQSVNLQEQIKTCRDKLYLTVERKGVVNDSEVIKISQELDKLIVSLQKIILSKKTC